MTTPFVLTDVFKLQNGDLIFVGLRQNHTPEFFRGKKIWIVKSRDEQYIGTLYQVTGVEPLYDNFGELGRTISLHVKFISGKDK